MSLLTPYLEKLVHSGGASVKTYTAGGAPKCTLEVGNDRYIIILKMIHFPYVPVEDADVDIMQELINTQMNVSSDKSFNSFVFRNDLRINLALNDQGSITNFIGAGSATTIETYLIHESDVSFAFSKGTELATAVAAIAPSEAPAKRPNVGYGKEGINTPAGNTIVRTKTDILGLAEIRPLGRVTPPTAGLFADFSAKELQFPVINGVTNITVDEVNLVFTYPIVQVQYIEIDGNPNNLRGNN